ncbi:MAG: hypothetical protein A3B81_02355 [Candidatus Muproteobacteria bacterium RIFCSPHIGHO2_02_FULL_65_16]|uniref:Cytochrome oxidase assembly protein n=1 Tax=Candidatus Muproteobacteria bacterium RIFCSPHIGHO2_02_FULL_65_16 TaxID=1817766 RepID=A0A1F6TTY6_9PROT|nr:MAG: hypothetical protein A3B81_02355 [Candidatus Muproteobacteria bacterium RIFCSPHIGHO2_02_FULL_65_16]
MNARTSPVFTFLVTTAVALMAGAIVFSSALRLSHAGLGCADWPACYGRITVPDRVTESGGRDAPAGSWKAVAHRLAGGVMGMVILAIVFLSWRGRSAARHRLLSLVLLGLTAFLAVLGRWTPTLTLPVITLANILAGFAMLAVLWWLWLDIKPAPAPAAPRGLKIAAYIGLALLGAQITLGGLVSANFAALSCATLPDCNGSWWPVAAGPADDLNPFHSLAVGADGRITPPAAAPLLHMIHRFWALFTVIYLAWLGLWTAGLEGLRRTGVVMLMLPALQVLLGALAVALSLPLAVVVAHNGVAALLLLGLVTLIHRLRPGAASMTAS